ncbi:MAG: S8 family serine peptidase [Campylobacteraceae bacterium]|nr:S8 family serine peptidase [Campylobacteraceae bacterium]
MKYLFFILLSILFTACSSDSSVSSDSSDLKLSTINDKYFFQQWSINQNLEFYKKNEINKYASINSANVLNTYSGKGIKIAIIDNGLDINHEDLKNAIKNSYSSGRFPNNVSQNPGENHGTIVTGIIAARANNTGIRGIAPDAQVLFLKYTLVDSDDDRIKLFEKAEEWGADIINCSWGTYSVSAALKDTIVRLSNTGRAGKGISIVFSSGNDARDIRGDESNIKEVISVGASDENNLRAYYSNFGQNLDVLAPGGDYYGITSLDPMGFNGKSNNDENYILYNDRNKFTGTSASAPIVVGVIALMLEKNPNLTRIEIENILKNTSDKIGNRPYLKGRNDFYGYGKINLENIMLSI